jgi:hypothetical protein
MGTVRRATWVSRARGANTLRSWTPTMFGSPCKLEEQRTILARNPEVGMLYGLLSGGSAGRRAVRRPGITHMSSAYAPGASFARRR